MAKKKSSKLKKSWKRRSKPGDAQVDIGRPCSRAHQRPSDRTWGGISQKEIQDINELDSITAKYQRVWVDVIGLGSETTLRTLANMFHMHPLVIEDVVNVYQRTRLRNSTTVCSL